MKFYDTNSILKYYQCINDERFALSSTTLHELEHIKTSGRKDEETKYRARRALHFLDENQEHYEVVIVNENVLALIDAYGLENTPDNQICASAKLLSSTVPVEFCTDDLCCRMIATHVFGLNISSFKPDGDIGIYKGYHTVSGNTNQINDYLQETDLTDGVINQYLIIQNTDDGTSKEMRFDGEKFVSLRLPPSKYIKAKNSLQRCALDILLNPDITVAAILGGYGSGKTYLSMQMGLYHVMEKGNQSKILGIREPRGEGKEVGFLPGTMDDKTENFFLPLVQQLNGGEFELESLKQRGILESNIPYYLKGTTYNDTIIICDEAEDLSESQLRLIGTRLGENSKIFFSGDYKQSLLKRTIDNPLVKMCNEFKGNPKFGCIYLGEDVRSETSKMFAGLFND